MLGGWVVLQHRTAHPLVTPALLRNRPLQITNVAGLCVGVAMFVAFLAVSGFVQTPAEVGYGFSASVLGASAAYLMPGALLGVVVAPVGGRLVSRYGGRDVLVLAAAVGAAGFVLMALLHTASWHLITGSLLVNGAVSLAFSAMPALIVAEVAPHQTGVANSVNSISRSVGSSLASALRRHAAGQRGAADRPAARVGVRGGLRHRRDGVRAHGPARRPRPAPCRAARSRGAAPGALARPRRRLTG